MVRAAELAEVAAADFSVAELAAQRGRDLEVSAHFQDAVISAARRSNLESLDEAGLVGVEIALGGVAGSPAIEVFGFNCYRPGFAGLGTITAMAHDTDILLPGFAGFEASERYLRSLDDDIWVSNGVAWSPDDKTMYFADSHVHTIFAYDVDVDAGTIGKRREFARVEARMGSPDGASVDAD